MRWGWILTLPVTVLLVVFAVMNRTPVHVELWPWPWDAEMPLFLLLGAAALTGFALGALAMWASFAGKRRKLRELNRSAAESAREIKELRSKVSENSPASGDTPRLSGPA